MESFWPGDKFLRRAVIFTSWFIDVALISFLDSTHVHCLLMGAVSNKPKKVFEGGSALRDENINEAKHQWRLPLRRDSSLINAGEKSADSFSFRSSSSVVRRAELSKLFPPWPSLSLFRWMFSVDGETKLSG
jgi:hypothetical protein